jgi:hydrogenase nickel incorporation protein HypA/HybF
MHEMALCESIVQIIAENAREQGYTRVKRVWLEIGPLAGVELDALYFGFEVVARGTVAQGACLEVVQPLAEAWCMACAKTVELAQRFDPCPHCGGFQLQMIGGDQMRVKELEVEA